MRSVAALLLLALCGCRVPLLDVPALVRGHQEIARSGDAFVPLVLGRKQAVGLCLEVPAATDTSRWEASLSFAGHATEFAAPAARMAFRALP